MARIDFWFSIGSTYSYLTVMRLPGVAEAEGVSFRWRPFDVRHVMVAQGNIPFKGKPVKSAYMWRDIERRAARYGLSPRLPAPYPLTGLVLANRVALLGMQEGWGEAYARATYKRWFEAGAPPGEDPNLSGSVRDAGQDPSDVLARAEREDVGERLLAETEEAMALGVFGSPSLVVGSEVFWGDDRLEDAVLWAKAGSLA